MYLGERPNPLPTFTWTVKENKFWDKGYLTPVFFSLLWQIHMTDPHLKVSFPFCPYPNPPHSHRGCHYVPLPRLVVEIVDCLGGERSGMYFHMSKIIDETVIATLTYNCSASVIDDAHSLFCKNSPIITKYGFEFSDYMALWTVLMSHASLKKTSFSL